MPMYEYECPIHGRFLDTNGPMDKIMCRLGCERRPCKRVWGFNYKPPMQEHFNTSVGKTISNPQQFKDELAKASDAATERTGVPHNYQPIDPQEKEALGATDEGLDATRRRARDAPA